MLEPQMAAAPNGCTHERATESPVTRAAAHRLGAPASQLLGELRHAEQVCVVDDLLSCRDVAVPLPPSESERFTLVHGTTYENAGTAFKNVGTVSGQPWNGSRNNRNGSQAVPEPTLN